MVVPEKRLMVKYHRTERLYRGVKVKVLREVGEKVVEFEDEYLSTFLGIPWHKEKDQSGIILYPPCAQSSGFERRGKGALYWVP